MISSTHCDPYKVQQTDNEKNCTKLDPVWPAPPYGPLLAVPFQRTHLEGGETDKVQTILNEEAQQQEPCYNSESATSFVRVHREVLPCVRRKDSKNKRKM